MKFPIASYLCFISVTSDVKHLTAHSCWPLIKWYVIANPPEEEAGHLKSLLYSYLLASTEEYWVPDIGTKANANCFYERLVLEMKG